MSEFLLIFRSDYKEIAKATPEQMQVYMKDWQKWTDDIIANNQLAGGNHLEQGGRVLHHGGIVTDGPFAEIKESILGYIIVKVKSLEEAVAIARKCPLLNGKGNTVEVRQLAVLK